MTNQVWTIDDHLRNKPPASLTLFHQFENVVRGFGDTTVSVSKTTVTFKGTRRGFAGARPTQTGIRGYFDLTRSLGSQDHRILSVAPYQRNLHVHQFTLHTPEDLDDEFTVWLSEAYQVGCGAHLRQ